MFAGLVDFFRIDQPPCRRISPQPIRYIRFTYAFQGSARPLAPELGGEHLIRILRSLRAAVPQHVHDILNGAPVSHDVVSHGLAGRVRSVSSALPDKSRKMSLPVTSDQVGCREERPLIGCPLRIKAVQVIGRRVSTEQNEVVQEFVKDFREIRDAPIL